jgi:Zn-dependent metalloprotease/subtilisin family serine protease
MRRLGPAVRTASVGFVSGVIGTAISFGACWLLLSVLSGLDTSDGLIADMLRGQPSAVLVTSAAATGAPVRWWVPGLGLGGDVWPLAMLVQGSPLAALALAPLLGGLTLGGWVAVATRRRGRALPLLVVATVTYAATTTTASAVASAASSSSFVVVRTPAPLVFVLAIGWAAGAGWLGRATVGRLLAGHARSTRDGASARWRRTQVPVLTAVITLLLTMLVVGSGPGHGRPVEPAQSDTGTVEQVPVGKHRPGVPEALAAIRATSGDRFQVAMDPWRGVPSFVSMESPFTGDAGSWLRTHAGLFGIADPTSQLIPLNSGQDALKQRHIWFNQTVQGLPVFGARVGLHVDASGSVDAVSNGSQPALVVGDTRPTLRPERALGVATGITRGARAVGRPQLMLLADNPHPDRPTPSTLVWRVVVSDPAGGEDGTWAYFVDAHSQGRIVRAVQVSAPIRLRRVWDYHNQPVDPTGPADRAEGDPPAAVADVNQAYDYTGDFYRYYSQVFGRDSYDNHGAPLLSMVRYSPVAGQPYQNAFWNGEARVFFGEGMATREIVGHEWTHAVIQSTADLIYQDQSGALNESFADIFGESIENFATGSNNWLMGTGSAIGTIRSFSNPPDYGQPDHLRDYVFDCFDSGGVHTNSGISNKAFYVLSQRIGINKAAAINYRALTVYLAPTSGFTDARNAAIQSAWDIYGKTSQEATEVWRAWGSVGVDGQAELPRLTCRCFAESSLHGAGLSGLDSSGPGLAQVTSALLRARDLLDSGASPALSHYGLLYRQANSQAIALLSSSPDLQQRTAHAMQSLAPVLSSVQTPVGGQVVVTRALVDELTGLMNGYAAADRAHGSGELAQMLDNELAKVDTDRLVGMTANEAKIYLDQISSGTAMPGTSTPSRSAVVDPDVQHMLTVAGRADVIVLLKDHADLSAAASQREHAKRTAYVYRQLGLTARRSQQGLHDLLVARHASFEQFWIVNAILVRNADPQLVAALAGKGEVGRIRRSGSVLLQDAQPSVDKALDPGGVEWGVARIRAPEVWSTFGTDGDGIVVANIDTGVQYTHPALQHAYRGTHPDGSVDHNYNWYDPAATCGPATNGPCDNNNHGTHTMGTMVGLDGTNQIGVAPGASWIAAKGCESNSCSDSSLLRAGQWVIAPTDLSGQNPRPDLAPNVVNNSWGGGGGDPFYNEIVNAWVQAGIFPAFANGNAGPVCGSVGSPGDYPSAFAVGAFDDTNTIAAFSSRGPSFFGNDVKPNLSAPGVKVRSSVTGSGYATFSGTSMATPHVAGAVALLWSATPSLRGDIAATRQLLTDTATRMPDATCGGSDSDNNVWGAGRLDVYSAVALSPHGPMGSIIGTVTDSHNAPLAGATVTATGSGNVTRTSVTDSSGSYSLRLPVGTYQVNVSNFAFTPGSASATVTEGASTRKDIRLLRVPAYLLRGQVLHDGVPVRTGTVSLVGVPLPTSSIQDGGGFGIPNVPAGQYTLSYTGDACAAPTTVPVTVNWDKTVTIAAADRVDPSGYRCGEADAPFPSTSAVLPLTGDDAATAVALPFPFPYYGGVYSTAYVSTNGLVNFDRPDPIAINVGLPSIGGPNTAIYPFWDDLVVDSAASVRTGISGTSPSRTFVVEWRNVTFADDPQQRVTFAVALSEGGQITMHYGTLTGDTLARGASATIGIEDSSGDLGIEYLHDTAQLTDGTVLAFRGVGMVMGTVTNASGDPIVGVTVSSEGVSPATTDFGGRYRMALSTGTHILWFTHPDYVYRGVSVTIANDGDIITKDITLAHQHNTVSGHVYDENGVPWAGLKLNLVWYDWYTTTTDANGAYRFPDVGPGPYNMWPVGLCMSNSYASLNVDGDLVADEVFPRQQDAFGHKCYVDSVNSDRATTALNLTGDDSIAQVNLPFPISFYGTTYTSVYVSTNGMINFTAPFAPPTSEGYGIPSYWDPNGAIYACWDNFVVDAAASVTTATLGTGTDRRFVVEWHNVAVADTGVRLTVQVEIYANDRIRFQFLDVPTNSALNARMPIVGIEHPNGASGIQILNSYATMTTGTAIELKVPT